MDDKIMMATVLSNTKSACDLMLHGSVESSTSEINSVFKNALNQVLTMQKDLYAAMSKKGWYPTEAAPQTKIEKAKRKYASA